MTEAAAIKKDIAELHKVLADFRSDMTKEFKTVRSEMTQEFTAVRSEMALEFRAVRREIRLGVDDVLEQIDTVMDLVDGRFTDLEHEVGEIRRGLKLAAQ